MIASPTTPKVAMTIAGSDNSAGAGIQADLKTFAAHGVYGLTALTCVVAEVPGLVETVELCDPTLVAAQIRLGFRAFPVRAVKTGMLFSETIIETVCRELSAARDAGEVFHLVVDPVMVASSGDPLLEADAVESIKRQLLPLADLVTPNLDEAAVLLGRRIPDHAALRAAGPELVKAFGVPFLLKGGHLGGDTAVDYLFKPDGSVQEYEAPFLKGLSPHGTGCTFSAAIAAHLASGMLLNEAVAKAKTYITAAIQSHCRWERGDGETVCLNHAARCD